MLAKCDVRGGVCKTSRPAILLLEIKIASTIADVELIAGQILSRLCGRLDRAESPLAE